MIEFIVKPDDADQYNVTATARDILVWEKGGKHRSFTTMMQELPLVDLYKIAWIASRRHGLYDGTQEAFETTVDLVFDEEEINSADPTLPAVSPDSA